MTWPKKGAGFFQCQEPLLSAPGSQFVELVIGNVLDAACDIGYAAGVEEASLGCVWLGFMRPSTGFKCRAPSVDQNAPAPSVTSGSDQAVPRHPAKIA